LPRTAASAARWKARLGANVSRETVPVSRSLDESVGALLRRHGLPSDGAAPLGSLLRLLARPEAPTSVHDPRRGIDVHIADSLAALGVIEELRAPSSILDLGAGAGLPGLVLASVLPESRVVLLEAAARKCEFLRSAIAAMGLENAEVVWARAEAWPDGIGRFDVACARALAALPVICEYAAPLLREGGLLVAWKGAVPADEAADATAAAAHLGLEADPVRHVMPYAGSGRRTLHVLRKVAPTPSRYPRRPGMAAKRPLSAKTLR
jgi:16S rRNA (guanine527-N7)-methyltransferase